MAGPNYSSGPERHPKSPMATTQHLHAMDYLEIVPERVQAVRTLVQLGGGIDELTMPYQRIVLTYFRCYLSLPDSVCGLAGNGLQLSLSPYNVPPVGDARSPQPRIQLLQKSPLNDLRWHIASSRGNGFWSGCGVPA
ncbi:hypothetical protein G647_02463 [Cladophialophora carrionii CBS 160.54]|uniref:Uncharacterized protein n=1 Tax=Cladophialophora carrionii CBS 160.54 TaxID=1279043 RepID=V9DFL9_9EURO|nr:uncharacterized protein G647_02463 [Cladophialophora carrionii CBS 160.54]ETI25689.1 hypothetical protein G647_02463 [Cladophialophora carrionii CBS 160.54]